MKSKIRLFAFILSSILLTAFHVSASTYARISDRVFLPPASGKADPDWLKNIVTYEIIKVDGKNPKREKMKKSGDPPYVLLETGDHDLKILKKRALSRPGDKGHVEELKVSVKAGLIYSIKEVDDVLQLVKSKK